MNWYSVFYWLTVSEGVKGFFDTASNIFTWFAVLSFIALIVVTIGKSVTISADKLKSVDDETKSPDFRAWTTIKRYIQPFFYTMLGLSIFTWAGWTLVPSKKDCALIIAGGTIGNFMANDTSVKKTIPKAFNLLNAYLDKVYREQLTPDERKDLGVKTTEDKKSELIEKIKTAGKDKAMAELDKFLGLESDSTAKK